MSTMLAHHQYTGFRNRLAGLIRDLPKIQAAWEQGVGPHFSELKLKQDFVKTQLERAAQLESNAFSIALLAEFQGGKSTTVNALCGGVEFSVRGDGVTPTSSCVVRIRHDEDAARRDMVEVVWRTEAELYELFRGIMPSGLPDTTPAGKTVDGVLSLPQVGAALDAEWKKYEANRGGYEHLDILRVGRLIHAAWRYQADIKAMWAQKELSVATVHECMRFGSRYERMELSQATPINLRFLFIREVRIPVDSPVLKEIGIEVVDCPGLNARTYDSRITQELLSNADATMALISTDGKQMSASQVGDLKRARDIQGGHGENLFVCQNTKGKSFADFDGVISQKNTDILDDNGLKITTKIWNYHALLAHLALQGRLFLSGKLPEDSKARFMAGGTGDYAAKWCAEVNGCLGIAGLGWTVSKLDEATCSEALKASRFGELADAIKNFVVKVKGNSVLIAHGANPMVAEMEKFRSSIVQVAGGLGNDVEQELESLRKQKNVLGKFQADVERAVETEIRKLNLRRALTDKYVADVLVAACREAQPKLAGAFLKGSTWTTWTHECFEQVRNSAPHIIRTEIEEKHALFVTQRLSVGSGWHLELRQITRKIEGEMQSRLSEISGAEKLELASFHMPALNDRMDLGMVEITSEVVEYLGNSQFDGWLNKIFNMIEFRGNLAEGTASNIASALEAHCQTKEVSRAIEDAVEKFEDEISSHLKTTASDPLNTLQKVLDGMEEVKRLDHAKQVDLKKKLDAFDRDHVAPFLGALKQLQSDAKGVLPEAGA